MTSIDSTFSSSPVFANPAGARGKSGPAESTASEKIPSFKDMFSDYLNSVNTHQQTAGAATEHFVLGEVPELHELMIALEKANVGLELTVALRDKLLEAYRELMRMQI